MQYQSQIRDAAALYDKVKENPALADTRLGDMARARLGTLDARVNPSGPNVPMLKSLDRLVR